MSEDADDTDGAGHGDGPDHPFDIVPPAAIRDGTATDDYFLRTERALDGAGRNPHVVAEVTLGQFPSGDPHLFSGIEDAVHLFEDLPVDVHALAPGTFFDGGPVVRIEGPYRSFARHETSLLGFLSQATAFATAAHGLRRAAPETPVVSFGARHLHPSLAAVLERSALLAGLDGFSHVAAGEVLGREATGTMPHALVICFGRGEQEAAWRAFDEHVDAGVARTALVDTYSDEVDEAIRAAEAVDGLSGIRLDTTGSRRGDFRHICREVRWELDARGHEDVDVFVSGGLEAEDLRELRDVVDGFGVGGAISDADPVDFGLDIVAVEGEPAAKRGKLSLPKQVYRTPDGAHHLGLAREEGPPDGEALLEPVVADGEVLTDFDLDESIERAREDAELVFDVA
ncbi:nicotinate phosphoribosyltransferase [Haloglomus litoreum]|uniref:nicotinate phosphoribosyltransferase n=1 Tax=Haloglomus litoreum TaxID=3034026 RepID=UPI0023E7F75E|nr:nicotinate phosphoribosyltransferase [Haloglomus sp. DT116]